MNTHDSDACLELILLASLSIKGHIVLLFLNRSIIGTKKCCCMFECCNLLLKKKVLSGHLETIIRQLYLKTNSWHDICLLIYCKNPDKQVRHVLPLFC